MIYRLKWQCDHSTPFVDHLCSFKDFHDEIIIEETILLSHVEGWAIKWQCKCATIMQIIDFLKFFAILYNHSSQSQINSVSVAVYFPQTFSHPAKLNFMYKMFSFPSHKPQCKFEQSTWFGFLVKFMLNQVESFEFICGLCPFGSCYRQFMRLSAAFQIVRKFEFSPATLE